MARKAAGRSNQTVLIVDKHLSNARHIAKQLKAVGLTSIVALTGEGCIRKAAEQKPDLILLETELTDMDGMELLSHLQGRPATESIPVIAMSVYPYLKFTCLQSGCRYFLKKPVKFIELMKSVRKILPLRSKTGSYRSRHAY